MIQCSFFKSLSSFLTFFALTLPLLFVSAESYAEAKQAKLKEQILESQRSVDYMMKRIRHRIKKRNFRWDLSLFHERDWKRYSKNSVNNLPLIYWSCGDEKALNRSLILSAVHGDEVTPVFFGFRVVEWLKANPKFCDDKFVVVAPIVNPDGFLRYTRGTRTNYNKVDLNRNFDTPDWEADAHKQWKLTAARRGETPQRRYFPGEKAASEPEIHFQKWLIETYQPTKIMSVHAPLKFFEFNGPSTEKLKIFAQDYISAVEAMKKRMRTNTKILRFKIYGTFPGSLGNYAGRQKGIPTVTTELPSSNAHNAAEYFGELEKSTRVFIDFDFSKENAQNKISKAN